jgi:acyl-CoA thioesterase-1
MNLLRTRSRAVFDSRDVRTDGDAMTRRLGALAAVTVAVLVAVPGPAAPVRAAAAAAPSCSPARPVRPVIAVIGASFAAGVGAAGAAAAWPADLGRMLRRRVVVSAVPGAGYLSPGAGRRGPFAPLAVRLGLARLRPSIVLIQGGHNDVGRPPALLRRSVHSLIASIRCATPGSRIGIVSVFPAASGISVAERSTDRVIVAAARSADPGVVVFDPVAQNWRFPRIADHLHPTAAGHRLIAARIAAGLTT